MQIRDRIRDFRRVRAADLQPHPYNWRTHPAGQQAALQALLDEIGYAGALLVRELPDGGLQLIDGHLRAETTPEQLVPVLVLDVNEAEANKLLAFYDPLSALAGRDAERAAQLAAEVATSSPSLRSLLGRLRGEQATSTNQALAVDDYAASYHLVVQCADEAEQRALFERFTAEGLSCRVLTM